MAKKKVKKKEKVEKKSFVTKNTADVLQERLDDTISFVKSEMVDLKREIERLREEVSEKEAELSSAISIRDALSSVLNKLSGETNWWGYDDEEGDSDY